jgi:hypothetical protein
MVKIPLSNEILIPPSVSAVAAGISTIALEITERTPSSVIFKPFPIFTPPKSPSPAIGNS